MSGKKILIVEDESDLRFLIREGLVSTGYDVREAVNGQEALDLIAHERPDVIISDVLMPQLDGNMLYKELCKTACGKNIPFIILTARVHMQDYFEVMQVDGFLTKPFKIQELVAKIEEVLKKFPVSLAPDRKVTPAQATSSDSPQVKLSGDIDQFVAGQAAGANSGADLSVERPGSAEGDKDRERRRQMAKCERRRVLLGEDNRETAGEISRYLIRMGFGVEVIATVQECQEAAYDLRPDIVILSYVVGEVNATDIADKLKSNPAFSHVPIIIYHSVFEKDLQGRIRFDRLSPEGKQLLQKIQSFQR